MTWKRDGSRTTNLKGGGGGGGGVEDINGRLRKGGETE